MPVQPILTEQSPSPDSGHTVSPGPRSQSTDTPAEKKEDACSSSLVQAGSGTEQQKDHTGFALGAIIIGALALGAVKYYSDQKKLQVQEDNGAFQNGKNKHRALALYGVQPEGDAAGTRMF